jgi:hypothetical protein
MTEQAAVAEKIDEIVLDKDIVEDKAVEDGKALENGARDEAGDGKDSVADDKTVKDKVASDEALKGEDGKDEKDTRAELPENWRDLAADGDDDTLKLLKRYGSLKGVAKALKEAQSTIRSGKLVSDEPMPDPEKEPDKAKAWREARKIPEDATGYVLPETVTKRMTDDDKPLVSGFTEYAHAKGARPETVAIATEWYFDMAEKLAAEEGARDKEAKEGAEEALRQSWGNGEYKGNLTLARRFVESIPGVGAAWSEARLADGRRIGDIPEFMEWASDQGRSTFGDAAFASSDSEARHDNRKAEIEKIMNTDFPRYEREGLDKEMAQILEREAKRRK